MKEFHIEAHVHLMADDLAGACEAMAEHFRAVAKVYRGDASADEINIDSWKPRSTFEVRPVFADDMN